MSEDEQPLSGDEAAEAGALDETEAAADALERSGRRQETAEGGALDEEDDGAQ